MSEMGLIHVYYGDGKGKTTLGMGLCCRAAGAGKRVLVCQFMKDGLANERKILEASAHVSFANDIRAVRFSFRMSEAEKEAERARYRRELARAFTRAKDESYDVLFLDEALYAISCGLLEEERLTEYLDRRPEKLEVILTGGEVPDAIRKRADYISCIKKEKHPYDRGIAARDGIEM